MKSKENNYAFIDSQNLHLGIKGLGWILDFQKFRIYLKQLSTPERNIFDFIDNAKMKLEYTDKRKKLS